MIGAGKLSLALIKGMRRLPAIFQCEKVKFSKESLPHQQNINVWEDDTPSKASK